MTSTIGGDRLNGPIAKPQTGWVTIGMNCAEPCASGAGLDAPPQPATEREVLRTPKRLWSVLGALFGHRAVGRVRLLAPGRPVVAPIHAARLHPTGAFRLRWQFDAPAPPVPFQIEIEGYLCVFRFEVRETAQADGFLATSLPDHIDRVRHRADRRVPAPEGVIVSLTDSRQPDAQIRRPVYNVSFGGLSFATRSCQDPLRRDLLFDTVVIEWADRLRLEFEGVIRGLYEDAVGRRGHLAGLELTPRSPDDAAHWHAFVLDLLCPRTRCDGRWSRQIWDAYQKSGYFELSGKTETDFAPLRTPFAAASRRLATAPAIGCQAVWPSNRGVEATASLLTIYQETAFLYQVARQHGRASRTAVDAAMLRDIHMHAVSQLTRHASLRWLLVWVQESATFSRRAYQELPERYVSQGRALVLPFRAMEGACDKDVAVPHGQAHVESATSGDIEMLLATIARTRPQPYCDAHDFMPERFGLDQTKERWKRAGLHRSRTVLCAHDDDAHPAAVLESASDGLHLFGLLDAVRLFALTPGGERLFPALLHAARRWYRRQGKRRFVYVMESGDLDAVTAAGFVDLGGAYMALLEADLLPELIEHIDEIVALRHAEFTRPPV